MNRCTPAAFLLVHVVAVAACIFVGVLLRAGLFGLPAEELVYFTCIALLVLFVWSFWSWQTFTATWFDPYTIFLLAAHLFNAGQAFLEVFHLDPSGLLAGSFAPETVLDTLFLVFLGLAALHMGALAALACQPRLRAPDLVPEEQTEGISPADVRVAAWCLLLVSAGPAALQMKDALQLVLSAGYLSLYQREAIVGISNVRQVLAALLVPTALFLLAGSKASTTGRVVSGAVVLVNACCQLFMGHRYYAIMPLVAYTWLWHIWIRPVPSRLLLTVGVALFVIVFPVIAATRETRGEDRLAADALVQAFSALDNPAVAIVSEMGGSMQTVAHTLELVPGEREHDQGLDYLYGLSTLVPNLFWDIHPAVARGAPADWLIWRVDPLAAAQGINLGYSFIAEAYFNFGWVGTPVVTFLIGFAYSWVVLWAIRPGPGRAAKLALIASFATMFTFYAREDVMVVTRSLVWYCLGPYCLAYVIHSLRAALGPHRQAQPLPGAAL